MADYYRNSVPTGQPQRGSSVPRDSRPRKIRHAEDQRFKINGSIGNSGLRPVLNIGCPSSGYISALRASCRPTTHRVPYSIVQRQAFCHKLELLPQQQHEPYNQFWDKRNRSFRIFLKIINRFLMHMKQNSLLARPVLVF